MTRRIPSGRAFAIRALAAAFALAAGAVMADVWYVPGWNRTDDAERTGAAFAACTNLFDDARCVFWQWDGERCWFSAVANADAAARRLADQIAGMDPESRSALILVGHSLGARIVARALAELARRDMQVAQGFLFGAALPMEDSDLAEIGGGSREPVIAVVNPKDPLLKYVYAGVGGEGGPPFGTDGSPGANSNVVEYAVGATIAEETRLDALWARSLALKRLFIHYSPFYFTEASKILSGSPSPNALPRVPQDNINLEWKVIDAGVWWDVLDECDGWKLERHVITGHCRIISPARRRAAWGSEEKMLRSFQKVKAVAGN